MVSMEMQPCIAQTWAALRNEQERAALVSSTVLEIVIQEAACFVGKINITRFGSFSSYMQLP